jgi:transposase-like protein
MHPNQKIMKEIYAKSSFSLSGIVCSTLGHDYAISRKITNHINEYKCTKCGKEVTDNFVGRVENLTLKTKQVNTSLALFFEKKMRRKITFPYEKISL